MSSSESKESKEEQPQQEQQQEEEQSASQSQSNNDDASNPPKEEEEGGEERKNKDNDDGDEEEEEEEDPRVATGEYHDDSVPSTFPDPPAPPGRLEYPEEGETLMRGMEQTVERYGDKPALHWQPRGDNKASVAETPWEHMTWREYREAIRKAAKSMIALGLQPGGCVSLQSFNCPRYFFAAYGANWAGGYAAGIYTTNTPGQSAYVAEHSESRLVFVEDGEQLRKFLKERDNLPGVHRVVLMHGDVEEAAPEAADKHSDWVMSWAEFERQGESRSDDEVDERVAATKPEDLAALIYTSGTTGKPKAVMITHRNVTFSARMMLSCAELGNSAHGITYLPLSHIAAQILDMHCPLLCGAQVWFARADALKGSLKDTMKAVRPTFFFGVPRVWEKFHEKMLALGKKNPAPLRALASWAKSKGLAASYARQNGQPAPWFGGVADSVVGARVRSALGLDRCEYFYSAAAPISTDTVEYFMSLGIRIHQAYGLSECSGITTVSLDLPGLNKVGTVGRAAPGTELRLADDGEVLFRGPHIFKGYLRNEEATREAIDEDGWLHSGDMGSIDQHGFLRIVGRKKELAISAGGENIAPLELEDALRSIPVVAQCVVVADRRKFVSALIALDTEQLGDELKKCGSDAEAKPEAVAKDDKFCKHLQKQIDKVNEDRMPSRAAYVRKFTIVPEEFSVDNGLMTPTHKIKRTKVEDHYRDEIEAMYE